MFVCSKNHCYCLFNVFSASSPRSRIGPCAQLLFSFSWYVTLTPVKIIFIVGGTVNISLKYRNYWYRRYFLEHFHYRSEHRNSFGMLVSLRKQLPPPPGRYNLRSFRVFLCHRRMAGTSYNVCYTKACIQHNTCSSRNETLNKLNDYEFHVA